jgi:FAD/FMN-containing dehydrogenase
VQVREVSVDTSVVDELRGSVAGSVIVPGDAAYDDARAVYFTATDRRPGVIVRPAEAADVACVVRIARSSGSELAVRNGGHSPAGHGVIDGGIVLDLRGLRGIHIDVARRVARAGAGVPAGEYTRAAGGHGLATGFGDAPSVAVGGITVAGGIGFLHRKFGMTIDSLVAAEVVTAAGDVVRADADSHADLFWAIRGGGGNFGVVTEVKLALHPVNQVLGGMLMLPATPQRLVDLLAIADAAPDELSLIAAAMPAPPMPMIPPEHHGRMILMVILVYCGDIQAGEGVIAPIRALATPLLDAVRPMDYPEIYAGHEGQPHPAAVAIHSRFIDSLDLAAATRLFEGLQSGTAPMRVAQFRPLGGAVSRVSADATAFAHRDRRFMVNVAAMHERLADAPEHALWSATVAAELGAGSAGAYVGFLAQDGAARIREAYPGMTWDRLVQVKRSYDPENLFRGNHNIGP